MLVWIQGSCRRFPLHNWDKVCTNIFPAWERINGRRIGELSLGFGHSHEVLLFMLPQSPKVHKRGSCCRNYRALWSSCIPASGAGSRTARSEDREGTWSCHGTWAHVKQMARVPGWPSCRPGHSLSSSAFPPIPELFTNNQYSGLVIILISCINIIS